MYHAIRVSASICIFSFIVPATSARGQCIEGRLFASDAATFEYFGSSIAIDGDTAVVGNADDDTPAGVDAGSVYIYVRNGGAWTEQAHLLAPDAAVSDYFGYAVAIAGDTLVVGAYGDNTSGGANAGSAYVYVRSGSVWTLQQRLFAIGGLANDEFGAVAISGDTIIAGALNDDTPGGINAGSAYVFIRIGTVWIQQAQLLASDGAAGDWFGNWVALEGDTAVIAAQGDDTAGGVNSGSAYVFVRIGTVWIQQGHLIASDAAADDNFGWGVEISGDTAAVGAILDDTPGGVDAGSAYMFVRDGEGNWTEQAHLVASNGAFDDRFSSDIAIFGDTAVIGSTRDDTDAGADAGSAYVFTRSGGVWSQASQFFAPDGAADDRFGYCIERSGDSIAIGAWGDNTSGITDAGSAYVFDLGCPLGDLNCDIAVDMADVPHFIEALLATGNFTGCEINRADLNHDGMINGHDMPLFVTAVLGS